MNFGHTMFYFATLSQRNANLSRKARILDTPCFFATLSQRNTKTYPETAQISATPCFFATLSQQNATNQPKNSRILYQTALIDPSHNAKESISFHNFTHCLNVFINLHLHQPKTTTREHLIALFLNCRPIVTHWNSSTLAQDAVLNCYKKPAHNNYQFSNFFRRATSSCVVF